MKVENLDKEDKLKVTPYIIRQRDSVIRTGFTIMNDFDLLIIVPRDNSQKFGEKTPLMNWSTKTQQKIMY